MFGNWELGTVEEVTGPYGQSEKEEFVLEFGFCTCFIILGPQNIVWLQFLCVVFLFVCGFLFCLAL